MKIVDLHNTHIHIIVYFTLYIAKVNKLKGMKKKLDHFWPLEFPFPKRVGEVWDYFVPL